jgi:hypothetical protein
VVFNPHVREFLMQIPFDPTWGEPSPRREADTTGSNGPRSLAFYWASNCAQVRFFRDWGMRRCYFAIRRDVRRHLLSYFLGIETPGAHGRS